MTDTTVAPQGSVPAAAPTTNEVPINPNPTSSPNPIGSQAPPAPVGDIKGSEHRPQSRREAIQAAFDRAANPPPKDAKPAERPAPKAAEAKPGHNKPPPDEKIDLRKRPTTEPPQRGEHGHFAPREKPEGREPLAAREGLAPPPQPQQPRQEPQRLPEGTPFRDPLPRMSERAKYDWAQAPESVRADVHRMHQEFSKASNYYKASYEAFKPIAHFHQMAAEQGTTLERALTNYVNMEMKLRSDPVGGLDVIINNLGLKTPDGQRIGLRDIAYHVLNSTPDQLRVMQQGNQQQAAAQQIGALHQEVAGLKNALQQMHYQQQHVQTRGAVDVFADTHPRFDELGDLIEQELKLGFDLDTAYRRAELLRPNTAAQTRTTSAQTRTTDKSIHGAGGVAPSNGASRRPREASRTPRDAVQNAINRVNGF